MEKLQELYQLADTNDIGVYCFRLNSVESCSYQDQTQNCYIAIDPFQLISYRDEQTKLAHELGHCCTGSFYNIHSPFDIRQKHENRADKWAIYHTISVDELDEAVAEGYTEIWDLAEHFNVTEDFMRKAICWYTYGNLDTELYF